MRSFLVLLALCGAALAKPRPDVSLGYSYELGNNQNYNGPAPLPGTFGVGTQGSSSYDTASSGVALDTKAILQSIAVPESKVTKTVQKQTHHVRLEPIVTKHFYLHAAPYEAEETTLTKEFHLGRPEKHYRVVFIKAPEYHTSAAQLAALYPKREEQTVIYVLSKKPDELQIGDIPTPAPQEPSKPEVFFIKYKTPEEAAHAQETIQEKYKILGGQTKVTDGGIAPITSVIGSLGDHVRYGSSYQSSQLVPGSSSLTASGSISGGESVFVKETKVDPGSAYLPSDN